jgi:hypothetical protein
LKTAGAPGALVAVSGLTVPTLALTLCVPATSAPSFFTRTRALTGLVEPALTLTGIGS